MTSQQRSRQRAVAGYYASPNLCRNCGKVIGIPEGVKPARVREKAFCTRSCANGFNNTKRAKKYPDGCRVRGMKPSSCQVCQATTYSRGGNRKFCEQCYTFYRCPQGIQLPDVTKGALFG